MTSVDYLKIKNDLAEHMAKMFLASPGYQDYIRDRVRQMRKDPSGLWDDMPELVASKIKHEKEKQIQAKANQAQHDGVCKAGNSESS